MMKDFQLFIRINHTPLIPLISIFKIIMTLIMQFLMNKSKEEKKSIHKKFEKIEISNQFLEN